MSAGWKAAMMKHPNARLRADGKEQCVSLMINKQFRTEPGQKQAKTGKIKKLILHAKATSLSGKSITSDNC